MIRNETGSDAAAFSVLRLAVDAGDLYSVAPRPPVRNRSVTRHFDGKNAQAEKDEPQPHVVAALGLRITNWDPDRSSV